MEKTTKQELYCRHCGRTFANAGEWMNHDCDAQPVMMQPAQRDVVAILDNAPRCQVESDGDIVMGIDIEIPDNELFRGPAATLLVEMARRYIKPRKRVIAVGRCKAGGAFVVKAPVQPPADFADAIDEVLTPDRVPHVRNMADCEDEKIGEEFCRHPFLY